MPKYVVVEVNEDGSVFQTYGPFPGKKTAEEWRLKTMEQLAGIVGSRKAGQIAKAGAKLKVARLESRENVRTELALLEKRGY